MHSISTWSFHCSRYFQVTIKREKITWPGARIKKTGEGLPQHDQNTIVGDLYVTVDVDFPKNELDNEQRQSLVFVYFQKKEKGFCFVCSD